MPICIKTIFVLCNFSFLVYFSCKYWELKFFIFKFWPLMFRDPMECECELYVLSIPFSQVSTVARWCISLKIKCLFYCREQYSNTNFWVDIEFLSFYFFACRRNVFNFFVSRTIWLIYILIVEENFNSTGSLHHSVWWRMYFGLAELI